MHYILKIDNTELIVHPIPIIPPVVRYQSEIKVF